MQGRAWMVFCRRLHTSHIQQAVEKSTLSRLRKKTGFTIINCKKALEKFDNDINKAETYLRERAQKEGWAKATKLAGRPMSQGLIGLIIDTQTAAMVEVNCETDFVARNAKFQKLVSRTATLCLQHGKSQEQKKLELDSAQLLALPVEEAGTLGDMLAMEVGNIGENMLIRRAVYLQVSEDIRLGTYVHSAGPHTVKDNKCTMGKYGAILAFKAPEASGANPDITANIGLQLCQHIVGMNPKTIGSKELPPTIVEETEAATDLSNVDNKTDESLPSENTNSETEKSLPKDSKNVVEDVSDMMSQEFLMDSSVTVREFSVQNSLDLLEFVRYECGELSKIE